MVFILCGVTQTENAKVLYMSICKTTYKLFFSIYLFKEKYGRVNLDNVVVLGVEVKRQFSMRE